jgi:DNA-binding XRE family transcriptional regulator
MKPKVLKPSDLVKWRKKNGYSQITLGKALGVITITVYRWEKGMRAIPPFLHLALKYLEMKGGDKRKTKRRKE